jgi:hypothetical protein
MTTDSVSIERIHTHSYRERRGKIYRKPKHNENVSKWIFMICFFYVKNLKQNFGDVVVKHFNKNQLGIRMVE